MAARRLLGSLLRSQSLPHSSREVHTRLYKVHPLTAATASASKVQHEDRVAVRYQNMHDSLLKIYSVNGSGNVSVNNFMKDLLDTGLKRDDPRLQSTITQLEAQAESGVISQQLFMDAVSPNMPLIETALTGKFVVPEFEEFITEVNRIYEECGDIKDGKSADYIPELARVNPDLWGVSLCTTSGQRHSIGDSTTDFTMQSGNKCFTYAIAVEEYGAKMIHEYIGKEPSGQSFNSLFLNSEMKPHNPMINAGALVLSSLIKPEKSITEKTNFIMERFCDMAGAESRSIKCDIMTCDSEMETAHRNYALLHYMKDMKVFPQDTDINEVLKFYTRLCSVEVDCQRGAVMAATLANSGYCPITGKRVLSADSVCHTLSLMHSCGMYDAAGEFSFAVGLPAKSGVSGVIFVVIPSVMGFCLYSPLINLRGNSLKGLHFCQRLVETFNLHIYDSRQQYHNKKDPRRKKTEHKEKEVTMVMYAAHAGALSALQRYRMMGLDLGVCNYDGRTPLHVAAAEGHYKVAEMLLDCQEVTVNCTDRWSSTPLDEALFFGHEEVATFLKERGGVQGRGRSQNSFT